MLQRCLTLLTAPPALGIVAEHIGRRGAAKADDPWCHSEGASVHTAVTNEPAPTGRDAKLREGEGHACEGGMTASGSLR